MLQIFVAIGVVFSLFVAFVVYCCLWMAGTVDRMDEMARKRREDENR